MAATQLKLRRGTSAQHNSFTGAAGEITVVTDDWSLRVHDGVTAGGKPISGGGGSLSALSDVDATGANAPSNGQVLVYDAATSKWKPGSSGGGGGGGSSYVVNRFLTSGVWTKPANLQFVKIVAVTPGNGGNSGGGTHPWGTSNYYPAGGKGGFPGIAGEWIFTADQVPDTATVTIGAPGVGAQYNNITMLNVGGTRGGSVSFGDLIYMPIGAWQDGQTFDQNQNYMYESNVYANDVIRDGFIDQPTDFEYGGSGSSGLSPGWTAPGISVKGPYNAPSNATNNPVGPAGGGGGASNRPSGSSFWYYDTSISSKVSYQGHEYIKGSHGGEGWARRKPSFSYTPDQYNDWAQKRRGRAQSGDLFANFYGEMDGQAMSYERELSLAGSITADQLRALQLKWWGNGGGGGGIGLDAFGGGVPQNGGNGSFPGGGGGGGACSIWSLNNGGSGGNGGAGVIYVYSFIGSAPFAFS